MSDLLMFELGASRTDPIDWVALTDGSEVARGRLLDGAQGLRGVTEAVKTARVVAAILPGEQAVARKMSGVFRDSAKALAAAKLLLEDELAEPAADLRVGVTQTETGLTAFATRASIVAQWLDDFAAADIDLDHLTADFLALPNAEGEAIVVSRRGRSIVAVNGAGLAAEYDLFLIMGGSLFEGVRRALVFDDAADACNFPVEAEVVRKRSISDSEFSALIGSSITRQGAPNFLQRRLLKRGAVAAATLQWKRACILLASLAGLSVLGAVADGVRSTLIASTWLRAASTLHASAHPEAKNENPIAFAQALLSKSRGETQFLTASRLVRKAIASQSAVDLDRVRFNAAQKEIVIGVRSRTDASIEAMKSALTSEGADIDAAGGFRRTGDYWTGEIRVRLK